ncbi:integrase core domain protein-like protein, partial [Dinothrombium tinctorium]
SASVIRKFLEENIFLRHGLPRTVITGQGTQFLSKEVAKWLESRYVQHRITSPYHPEANGQAERTIRSIKEILTSLINSKKESWADYLPYAVFAYNTAIHESTKFSPFYLVYGRDPLVPTDLRLRKRKMVEMSNSEKFAENSLRMLTEMRDRAKKNMEKMKEKQLVALSRKQKGIEFNKGDLVLLNIPIGTKWKGSSLEDKFHGPYKILMRLNPNNYEVEACDKDENGNRYRGVVHIKYMKGYLAPTHALADIGKLSADILLGYPFFEKHKAVVDFLNDKLTLQLGRENDFTRLVVPFSKRKPCKLVADESICLLPLEEGEIPISLSQELTGDVEIHSASVSSGAIMTVNAIACASKLKKIVIFNTSMEAVEIRKGQKLAECMPLEDVNEITDIPLREIEPVKWSEKTSDRKVVRKDNTHGVVRKENSELDLNEFKNRTRHWEVRAGGDWRSVVDPNDFDNRNGHRDNDSAIDCGHRSTSANAIIDFFDRNDHRVNGAA